MIRSMLPCSVLTSSVALLLTVVAAPMSGAQPPFEQRQPQAPLDEPVAVKVSIGLGDEWTYNFGLNQLVTTQRLTTEGKDSGSAKDARLIQNATVSLTVTAVDEESGVATVEAEFERLLTIVGKGDTQTEYRWHAGSTPTEPISDLDRLLNALTSSTLTVRVSPSGKIRGVVGFEKIDAVLVDDPEIDPGPLGLFSASAIDSTLAMAWNPAAVAGADRNIADEWNGTRRASLGVVGSVEIEQRLAVERIEDGQLRAKGKTSLQLIPPVEDPGAGLPRIELLHDAGQVRLRWDLGRGCVASFSDRMDLGARWSLGDAKLGFSMRTERSAALDAPPKGTKKPHEL